MPLSYSGNRRSWFVSLRRGPPSQGWLWCDAAQL